MEKTIQIAGHNGVKYEVVMTEDQFMSFQELANTTHLVDSETAFDHVVEQEIGKVLALVEQEIDELFKDIQ